VFDKIIASVNPDAVERNSWAAKWATPLTEEERQHCQEVYGKHLRECIKNRPWGEALAYDETGLSTDPTWPPPLHTPESEALALDDARRLRLMQEEYVQRVFTMFGLNPLVTELPNLPPPQQEVESPETTAQSEGTQQNIFPNDNFARLFANNEPKQTVLSLSEEKGVRDALQWFNSARAAQQNDSPAESGVSRSQNDSRREETQTSSVEMPIREKVATTLQAKGCAPDAIETQISNKKISPTQQKVFDNALLESLPSDEDLAEGVKEAKELKKLAEEQCKARIVSTAFSSINTIATFIHSYSELEQQLRANREHRIQAKHMYDTSMERLGLEIPISSFYGKSLPTINELLTDAIKRAPIDNANAYLVAAEEYQRIVKETKQKIKECENLDGHLVKAGKHLQNRADRLHKIQEAHERKYAKRARALRGVSVIPTILQVAGSIILVPNPVVGAVVSGMGQLLQTGIGVVSQNGQNNYQSIAGRVGRALHNTYRDAQDLANSQGDLQNTYSALERQRDQQTNWLLSNLEEFTPMTQQRFLREEISGKKEALKKATSAKTGTDTELTNIIAERDRKNQHVTDFIGKVQKRLDATPDAAASKKSKKGKKNNESNESNESNEIKLSRAGLDHFIRSVENGKTEIEFEHGKKIKFKNYEDLKHFLGEYSKAVDYQKELPTLEREVAQLIIDVSGHATTVNDIQRDVNNLENALKDAENEFNLPPHLRKQSENLPLPARMASSNSHLETATSQRGQNEQAYRDAKFDNLGLHTHDSMCNLSNASGEEIAKALPDTFQKAITRWDEYNELKGLEQTKLKTFIDEEEKQRDLVNKAHEKIKNVSVGGGDIAQLLEENAPLEGVLRQCTKQRQDTEDRIKAINNGMLGEEYILSSCTQYLSKLPPSMRQELCDQLVTDLMPRLAYVDGKAPAAYHVHMEQLQAIHQVEWSTQLEQWHNAPDLQQALILYQGIVQKNGGRKEQLKTLLAAELAACPEGEISLKALDLEKQLKIYDNHQISFFISQCHRIEHAPLELRGKQISTMYTELELQFQDINVPQTHRQYMQELQMLYDIEKSTEWEQWRGASYDEKVILHKEMLENNAARQAKLKNEIAIAQSYCTDGQPSEDVLNLQNSLNQEAAHKFEINHSQYKSNSDHRLNILTGNSAILEENGFLNTHAAHVQALQASYQQIAQVGDTLMAIFHTFYSNHNPESYQEHIARITHGTQLFKALSSAAVNILTLDGALDNAVDMFEKAKDHTDASCAAELLAKSRSIILGCYLNPGLGTVLAGLEVYYTAKRFLRNEPLPVDLATAIGTSLQALGKNLQGSFNKLNDEFIEQNRQLKEYAQLLDEKLERIQQNTERTITLQLSSIVSNQSIAINQKSEEMRKRLVDIKRKIKKRGSRDDLSDYLTELNYYPNDILKDHLTGSTAYSQGLPLQLIAQCPTQFIGVLSSKVKDLYYPNSTTQLDGCANPLLVAYINRRYVSWQKMNIAIAKKDKENFKSTEKDQRHAENIENFINSQRKAYQQLCQHGPEQLERSSEALADFADCLAQNRRARLQVCAPLVVDDKLMDAVTHKLLGFSPRFEFTERVIGYATTPLSMAQKIADFCQDRERNHNNAVGVYRDTAIIMTGAFAMCMITPSVLPLFGGQLLSILSVPIRNVLHRSVDQNQIIDRIHNVSLASLQKDNASVKDISPLSHFDIELISKNGSLALSKLFFDGGKITQRDSQEFEKPSKDPELRITVRCDISGDNRKVALIDHPESWIKVEDLSAIVEIAKKIPENYYWEARVKLPLLSSYLRELILSIPTDRGQLSPSIKVHTDDKSYKDEIKAKISLRCSNFLEQTTPSVQIASAADQMLPLNFPQKLMNMITDSLALELDYYFDKHQKNLQPHYSFNYDKDSDIHTLKLAFGDDSRKEYFVYELQKIEGEALRSLTANQTSEESKDDPQLLSAQLLYLMYSSYFELGMPTKENAYLKSKKGIIICDDTSKPSWYPQLMALELPPAKCATELGIALTGEAQKWKKELLNTDKFKKYEESYYLAEALQRLTLCFDDKTKLEELLQHTLMKRGLIAPDTAQFFEQACRKEMTTL
jgi:hypothetical protein